MLMYIITMDDITKSIDLIQRINNNQYFTPLDAKL